MWSSWIIVFLVSLQPVCTRSQLEHACGDVLSGEYKGIALAMFDAYLDQVSEVDETDPLVATLQAASLLSEFTQSLAVLDEQGKWKEASGDLRRTVLLQSRKAANPWPATVWVDLSTIEGVNVSRETKNSLDAFLQQYYDEDLRDRFAALKAIQLGDAQKCIHLTTVAMKRWSEYQQIIEPYLENIQVLLAAFPKLSTGQEVQAVALELQESCKNSSTLEKLHSRFLKWSSWHIAQLRATAVLVHKARSTNKFDPWSPRCGTPTDKQTTKLQHELLQLSASVEEKNGRVILELQKIATTHETQ